MPSLLRSADVNRAESTICTKRFYANGDQSALPELRTHAPADDRGQFGRSGWRRLAGGDRRDAEQGLRPERHVGLRVDELQAVVFSEVLEILDVEGGQREPCARQHAAIQLSLAGRGRPRRLASAEILPHVREVASSEFSTTTRPSHSSRSSRVRGPQLRVVAHCHTRPRVTNVTHHVMPVSLAASGSPSVPLIARDATRTGSLTCNFSVELRGFEPLTPSMRTRCATGLRYSPENLRQRSKHRALSAPRLTW